MPETIRGPLSFRLNMFLLRPSVPSNPTLTWCDTSQIYKEVIRKMCVDASLYNLLIEY
ncbi:hypothetical protein BCV71DRAFT_277701 [Rhizopus microsporus]|uniref:Uncharacterized protein n=1 Tax=Rhizopus microsporus TaxID=58291 RepID=A0A1X0RNW6_RHIZD|nr:hypothetical protein BCV71DRAFT_277701 [Rhizopus microsporus]